MSTRRQGGGAWLVRWAAPVAVGVLAGVVASRMGSVVSAVLAAVAVIVLGSVVLAVVRASSVRLLAVTPYEVVTVLAVGVVDPDPDGWFSSGADDDHRAWLDHLGHVDDEPDDDPVPFVVVDEDERLWRALCAVEYRILVREGGNDGPPESDLSTADVERQAAELAAELAALVEVPAAVLLRASWEAACLHGQDRGTDADPDRFARPDWSELLADVEGGPA